MKERHLIVTGDDFGISAEVNRAIIQAHEEGILTSASLMVTGEAFDEAVALAQSHPRLGVGLHLVVVSGTAVLPPEKIPHIVDQKGCFPSDPVAAGLKYHFNKQARQELQMEIRAQLEKFQKTGLSLSHVDGHQHMHMPPVVLRILIGLAAEFKIKAIRLPHEELSVTLKIDRTRFAEKVKSAFIFKLLCAGYAKRYLRRAGIEFPERVYGLLQTGKMTENYLVQLIPKIQASSIEIYAHPITFKRGMEYDPMGASPEQLQALLSPRVRNVLENYGFRLGTYAELN